MTFQDTHAVVRYLKFPLLEWSGWEMSCTHIRQCMMIVLGNPLALVPYVNLDYFLKHIMYDSLKIFTEFFDSPKICQPIDCWNIDSLKSWLKQSLSVSKKFWLLSNITSICFLNFQKTKVPVFSENPAAKWFSRK